MPRPSRRSRTLRRISRTTPGGKNVLRYAKRKPASAKCAQCKQSLKGVPRARPVKMNTMPKTHKRPERPFGGVLCSACTRKKIKQQSASVQR